MHQSINKMPFPIIELLPGKRSKHLENRTIGFPLNSDQRLASGVRNGSAFFIRDRTGITKLSRWSAPHRSPPLNRRTCILHWGFTPDFNNMLIMLILRAIKKCAEASILPRKSLHIRLNFSKWLSNHPHKMEQIRLYSKRNKAEKIFPVHSPFSSARWKTNLVNYLGVTVKIFLKEGPLCSPLNRKFSTCLIRNRKLR